MTPPPATSVAAAATGLSTSVDYSISVEPVSQHIIGELAGVRIVDSHRALQVNETRHAAVYYFPKEDIQLDALTATQHLTHCPFKGDASYWSVMAGGQVVENMAWSYEEPYAEAEAIKGYVAFYASKMDAWYEDGECVSPALVKDNNSVAVNPLANWVISEAWEAATSRELTARLIRQLNEIGMRLIRVNVAIQTLHPLIVATAYRWDSGGEVERTDISNAVRDDSRYTNSPLITVYSGMGGVRRWIGADDSADDYPILADLRSEGATDYVAMPMRFSNGQINAVTLATDHPEGFRTEHLGWVHEILPSLSRYYEVHATRRTASTLMQTFLGRYTGQMVLDGLVKRGDGEDIHAVIWFCDLRNSTPIAETLGRDAFLGYLNRFFDCMAGAILENEGEVLRFIGDAVLAIFPIGGSTDDCNRKSKWEGECPIRDATTRAANAAREAALRVSVANQACENENLPTIGYGIGLHVGNVTYGNIGTEDRLEFTVIGSAANEAARVEGMTKDLERNVLVSQEFKESFSGDLEALGEFDLRGVPGARNLYALGT